jgi:hypothetical protein
MSILFSGNTFLAAEQEAMGRSVKYCRFYRLPSGEKLMMLVVTLRYLFASIFRAVEQQVAPILHRVIN